jgi:hypothetical protein
VSKMLSDAYSYGLQNELDSLSEYLQRIRTSHQYKNEKESYRNFLYSSKYVRRRAVIDTIIFDIHFDGFSIS